VKNNFIIGVCFLQALLVLNSCKKRDDLISLKGGTIVPAELYFSDTLTVDCRTVREDSIPSRTSTHQLLVGKMNDPLFGVSQATTFTQIRLAQLNNLINKGDGVDSAFLYLSFTSEVAKYGNIQSIQNLSLFELTEGFSNTKTYYSSDSLAYSTTPIGNFSGVYNYKDSMVLVDSVKKKFSPGIKIPLTKEFAEKLLDADVNAIRTQGDFANYIKGIAIKAMGNPAAGEGAVAAFNFKSPGTRIVVHYDKNKFTNFTIDSNSLMFANYKISKQNPAIVSQKMQDNGHFDTTYVQAMTGAKTYFTFPTLFSLTQNEKLFIHKAELIIPIIRQASNAVYPPPSRLLITQPNENTRLNLPIIDFISSSNYGGLYDSIQGQYKFGITRHIQDIFRSYVEDGDNFNFGLFLTPTIDLPITPARVLIDSRRDKPVNEKLRLVIIYSKL
jgi:hypothetical protein